MFNPNAPPVPHSELTRDDVDLLTQEVAVAALADARDYWRDVAKHDGLTGLHNKTGWHTNVANKIATGKPFAVFLFDLDNFKTINDTIGHGAGDHLLENFGSFLSRKFIRRDDDLAKVEAGENSILGRIGGDEFGIAISLWGNGRRGQNPIERLDREWSYVQAISAEFVQAQDSSIQKTQFGISFGAALWTPESGLTIDTLLRQADESMYEMKPEKPSLV